MPILKDGNEANSKSLKYEFCVQIKPRSHPGHSVLGNEATMQY